MTGSPLEPKDRSSVEFKVSPNQAQKLMRALKAGSDASVIVKGEHIRLNNNSPNLMPQLTERACSCKKAGKGMKVALSDFQKSGGILPLLIPALGPLIAGALTGGAAVTKTIMDNKRKYRELDETRRHNEALEKGSRTGGSGIYWTSKRGDGVKTGSSRSKKRRPKPSI